MPTDDPHSPLPTRSFCPVCSRPFMLVCEPPQTNVPEERLTCPWADCGAHIFIPGHVVDVWAGDRFKPV
jgi:hypothetical protein